ncbi:MAG TPA: hypothetical protein VNM48_00490 [Chloroflexota bacterium]|nr:hypothetical protein [Chloroflexota bacterium]
MSIENDVANAVEVGEVTGDAKDRMIAALLCATWSATFYKHLIALEIEPSVALNLTMPASYQMIEDTLNSASCGHAHESSCGEQ